jgi:hypothetical protein
MLIRRQSFLEAGGFDADYFAYLEDVDLGWRLWAGGERVTFVPDAVVHHRSSATSDLLGLFNRGFLFERNAFLTAYKNYEPGLWEKVMPAVLLAFVARTQSLLVGNPGADTLLLDPYSGHIANTASRDSPAVPASPPPPEPRTVANLAKKLRSYGPREFTRRGWRKLQEHLAPRTPAAAGPPAPPTLTDERTIAHFRALSYLLGNLDRAAAQRAQVQNRRRRSDREIFARFPPYLVPTYPGDAELFASPGFAAWLPEELPLVRKTLPEIMEWG